MVTCRTMPGGDNLPANHVCQAEELRDWGRMAAKGDSNAQTTLHVQWNCLHHSACLAKKPGLLSVGNLCSTLVRMARAMRSTKFQETFKNNVDLLAQNMVRRVVPELPSFVNDWLAEYNTFRDLVFSIGGAMSADGKKLCGQMFNDPWFMGEMNSPSCMDNGTWVHWCPPGCCASESDAYKRGREALRELLEVFCDVPLLYRWKHWEPCLGYVLRGTLIYTFLLFALSRTASQTNQNKLNQDQIQDLDEDSPDLSFAMKQEVRLSKTISAISAESFLVT